jgi:hypothetical protein
MALIFAKSVLALALGMVVVFSCLLALDMATFNYSLTTLFTLNAVDARHLNNLLNRNLNQLVAIIFAMVSIAVPLTANMYSLKFLEFFIQDRVNAAVLILVAATDVLNTWTGYAIKEREIPYIQLHLVFGLTIVCFALLFPYLYYVFRFLHPNTLLNRLEQANQRSLRAALKNPLPQRAEVAANMEHIANIAVRSVERSDRNTAIECLFSLERTLRHYWTLKSRLPADWFRAEQDLFLGFSSRAVDDFSQSRSWVEIKLYGQLMQVMSSATSKMPELTATTAKILRKLGLEPDALGDPVLRELTMDYFNSFIRLGINRRDLRTVFSLFDQYRLFAEACLAKAPDTAMEAAGYFEYYARVAREQNLAFLVEIVAHDLGVLVESAWRSNAPQRQQLLDRFIAFDCGAPIPLSGVKKAQAVLASYFLLNDHNAAAASLRLAFAGLPAEFLRALREDLLRVTREKFWEVNERRMNVDYVPPAQKLKLQEFFDGLNLSIQ